MAKKKRQGHYCRICGEWKANERFSGKGHAAHICKSCASLPLTKRNELQRINQVERLAGKLRLTKEEWDLLEKYAESKSYPELKRCAAGVLEHKRMAREFNRPSIEEIPFNNLDEERKEEIGELLYNDIVFFIEEADAVPNEKQLKRITKDIFKEYLRGFHWRIIPDATWEESMKKVLADALRDMEQPEFEE